MPIVNRVADLQPDIQAWRRDIHEHPELLYDVHRTAAFVADRLREFLGPEAGALIDQQMKMMIPLGGTLGDPTRDVGPMLVFLAGTGSAFITGQLLAVDGGLMMVGG